MGLNVEMVTFDCRDPARLAGWWAEQFGGTTHDILAGEFTAVSFPEGLRLGFQ
ncbi:VOC family protein, partial [Mycobacterium avium]